MAWQYEYVLGIFLVGVGITVNGESQGFYQGRDLKISSASDLYGNDVIHRATYLQSGAGGKSYLDLDTNLPTGKLQGFYIYLHNTNGQGGGPLYLQIWRPAKDDNDEYQLVWQKNQVVPSQSGSGALVTVEYTEGEAFQIESGDKIGWGYTNQVGVISYDQDSGHRTLSTDVQPSGYNPAVNQKYNFNSRVIASKFSVAVKVTGASQEPDDDGTSDDGNGISQTKTMIMAGVILVALFV